MQFGISPVGFVEELAATVDALRAQLVGGKPPAYLFHYTGRDAVVSIANTRCLRATCVSDLKDPTELRHGISLVEDEIRRFRKRLHPSFGTAILPQIAEYLRSRIPYTFVTSFCENSGSIFHWRCYGDYCLRFETHGTGGPLLQTHFSHSYTQFHRIIYGRRQRLAIRKALEGTVDAVNRHAYGIPEGPWADSVIGIVARAASELLIDLIVSFKRLRYMFEREWRLVVRPNPDLLTSAPGLVDKNFQVGIKKEAKGYVELWVPVQSNPLAPMSRPSVPFAEVIQSPFIRRPADLEFIESELIKNGASHIRVSQSTWCPVWPLRHI